jgi:hypothetical protein
MMKNKLIIGILLSIVMITIVSASMSSLGTFKQNDCVELKQTCASCSYVNFTRVSYPNSTRALDNVQATKDGSNFNYTFCSTSALGIYIVDGIGDVDGTDTVFAYDFEVTPTGMKENTTLFIVMILFASVLLFISLLFKNYVFAFLAGVAYLITGTYTMIYGFANLTDTYTRMISVVIIGFGLIVTVLSGLEFSSQSYSGGEYSEEYD